MAGLLKRLFAPKSEPIQEVNHPALGTLAYDRESRNWGKTVMLSGQRCRLSIGGEHEPDAVLLDRASKLETELPKLAAALQAFVARAADEMPESATEIRSLTVADIAIWWPKQPDAVMIWFDGPSPERIWHADYKGGMLSGLVCDK